MKEKFRNFILDKIFILSNQPVLFRDLLEANSLYNEGMLIDGAKLNFRFNYAQTYKIYAMICIFILLPLIIIAHNFFVIVDTHISILITIFLTSAVFLGFDMFKIWARKEMSFECIKKAWQMHFPYFSYEKYSKKVDEIYSKASKNNVCKRDLEQYVLENLIAQSDASK
ncbi:MAG: hypothetical protein K5978_03130 [Campylobacter sp.]|nr:hypothetical protein [Campylobacter sp.]